MTNMKRSLSDVDSESDGDFDDYKDGSPSQSCGPPSDRKKRRGIIEKRRRDRINNSLAELRRLVPTAFEKQGSAKLEKAEILQMTVDHLKVLHQKGLNGYNIDPTTLAMDYRSVGFRECAAEVARYLVTVEGLDIQDPLRLRLMSHLQCFSAQREVASKHTLQGSLGTAGSWGSGHGAQYGNGSLPPPPPPSMIGQHQTDPHGYPASMSAGSGLSTGCGSDGSAMSRIPPPPPPTGSHPGSSSDSAAAAAAAAHMNATAHIRLPTTASVAPSMPSSVSSTSSSPQVSAPPPPPPMLHGQFPSAVHPHHTQFPMSLNAMSPMLSPSASHHNYSSPHSVVSSAPALGQTSGMTGMMTMSSMKPYRPWGAELAY